MAESKIKVIPDTSAFIPLLKEGIMHPVLAGEGKTPLLYMSAVVMAELYAGVRDKASIKRLDQLYTTFLDLGRLIVPDAGDWQKTGKIAAQMGRKYGFEGKYIAGITNDILIALSARRIGAAVITSNIKDFLRIGEWVGVRVWEG